MQSDILQNLSAPLQLIVREIEEAAGFEIQVKHNSERKHKIGNPGDATVGAIPGYSSAVIEYDNALADVTQADYAHELMHLHRVYVQRVPHLFAKKELHWNAVAAIENQLEHVIIYGRLLDISPDFAKTFQSDNKQSWAMYPWGVTGSDLKFYSVTRYLITHLYGDAEAKSAMRSTLAADKTLYKTRKAAELALKGLNDKRMFVRTVLDYAEIPYGEFCLRLIHPKERRYEDTSV